ncbi:hypothetical protein AWM70_12545 [Paenibacillus yonginensis]|uniref:EspG family protein n=2 Tax=Paenibacillus yonginensis TaxID=1462996 RepID=A0A1B1N1N8_9BACL|nr:hypothetical protein AWM70_12545 [Paenibacillus yonginensis]
MTQQEEVTFRLSVREFFFLTNMLGIHYIAGFKDPFRGYLVEELEEEYEAVKRGLVERGFLRVIEGQKDSFEMDELLGVCLTTCGSNEAVYVNKRIKQEGDYEAFLYFTPNLVVERTWDELEGETVLAPVASAELSLNLLAKFFPLTLKGAVSFHANLPDMREVNWALLSMEEKQQLLLDKRVDPERVNYFVSLEKKAERRGSMVYWTRAGSYWEQEEYHYLQKGQDMLMITKPGGHELRIETYNPAVILKSLEKLAEKFDLVNKGA